MMKKALVILSLMGIGLGFGFGTIVNDNSQVFAHGSENHKVALLAENRSNLEICVQSFVPDETNDKAKDKIEKVVDSVLKKKEKWDKKFGHLDVQLKNGCDVQPYLLQKETSHPFLSGSDDPGRIVDKASESMYTIFVVPDKVINKQFKGVDIRTSPKEILCDEHVCREVTKGIYMSLSEFKSKNHLENVLTEALALEIVREDEDKLPENRKK